MANTTAATNARTSATSALIHDEELRALLERLATLLDLPLHRVCAAFVVGFATLIDDNLSELEAAYGPPMPPRD